MTWIHLTRSDVESLPADLRLELLGKPWAEPLTDEQVTRLTFELLRIDVEKEGLTA